MQTLDIILENPSVAARTCEPRIFALQRTTQRALLRARARPCLATTMAPSTDRAPSPDPWDDFIDDPVIEPSAQGQPDAPAAPQPTVSSSAPASTKPAPSPAPVFSTGQDLAETLSSRAQDGVHGTVATAPEAAPSPAAASQEHVAPNASSTELPAPTCTSLWSSISTVLASVVLD